MPKITFKNDAESKKFQDSMQAALNNNTMFKDAQKEGSTLEKIISEIGKFFTFNNKKDPAPKPNESPLSTRMLGIGLKGKQMQELIQNGKFDELKAVCDTMNKTKPTARETLNEYFQAYGHKSLNNEAIKYVSGVVQLGENLGNKLAMQERRNNMEQVMTQWGGFNERYKSLDEAGTNFVKDCQKYRINPQNPTEKKENLQNETEKLTITHSTNLQGKVLSFNPADLQENFTFENIRTFDHSFTPNDIYIVLLLSVFFQRFSYYNGYIPISEPSLKQLSKLLDELSHNMTFSYPVSPTIIEILKHTKRLVQTNMSLSNVIITETLFEVKDVLLYLHNNCKQKITIPILSKQFHINRTTLSDRFYEATGETIITYLNKYRINLAAIMLRETNHSISNIAEEVGFNDTAYFAKLFKKYMLHTPSGYRQHYFSLCQVHKSDEESMSV